MTHVPAVVAGWVIAEPMSKPNRRAVDRARTLTQRYLEQVFPRFQWRFPVVKRQKLTRMPAMEAVELLDAGSAERDRAGWDFAFVLTQADLHSHYGNRTLATPSQALGVAAISLARLDPAQDGEELTGDEKAAGLAQRLTALTLHVFGHLNDLPHAAKADCYMFSPKGPGDLDHFRHYSETSKELLQDALSAVADVRLEETRTAPADSLRFYIKATWHNRREIGHAIMETRFWRFPYHFSRLTTAAASTLVILLVTAEAWDLGMRQRPEVVTIFSLTALVTASLYVLNRQRIFDETWRRGLTERRVISRVSLTAAMLLGMTTTYAMLFAATIAISQVFYPPDLVREWASSLHDPLRWRHFFTLAGFIASLGIIIGALGASFEAQAYFRHVALVDEET